MFAYVCGDIYDEILMAIFKYINPKYITSSSSYFI